MKAAWEVKKTSPKPCSHPRDSAHSACPRSSLCVLLYSALHLVVQKSSPAPLTPPNLCRKHHTISPFSLHPLQVSTAIRDPCKAPRLQGRLRISRTASGLDSQRQGSPSSFQWCCKVIWSLIGKMGSPSLRGSHLEKVW